MSNNPVAAPRSSPVEHDPAAAKDAERKMRAGKTGIGDPESHDVDDEHDPAAVRDAERKMRGGATGIDDPDMDDPDADEAARGDV